MSYADCYTYRSLVVGSLGNDRLHGTSMNDIILGLAGADNIDAGAGNDWLVGGRGNDVLFGGEGNDTAVFDVRRDGSDKVDLGNGDDEVLVSGRSQVRLTFTSVEVGNGNSKDAGTMPNQDGGLAVRLQAEDRYGNLTGPVSRFDDEGIRFVSQGVKFDVRDLVSGAQRGDMFDVVQLGTNGNDTFTADSPFKNYYVNAGMGDDKLFGAKGNDFLVGGAGNDQLYGKNGNDSFIGGGGNDGIYGGRGDDLAICNVSTDGKDAVDLGAGDDSVLVNASAPAQIRLTFTSSEVGNGDANDSDTMANQDGGLALRLQVENAAGKVIGDVSRFDDEGINFEAGAGVTFDVRDLVSGVARGDQFQEVSLGTLGADKMTVDDASRSYYFNAGMGDDRIFGGNANDFLVGGAGNDLALGGAGDDTFIGGAGNDRLSGGDGSDAFIFAAPLSSTTNVDSISDFEHAVDTLRLDDAFFAGLELGPLSADALALSTAAAEADDRIVYDQASGKLYFDSTGNERGDAVLFAVLTNRPEDISAADFVVF